MNKIYISDISKKIIKRQNYLRDNQGSDYEWLDYFDECEYFLLDQFESIFYIKNENNYLEGYVIEDYMIERKIEDVMLDLELLELMIRVSSKKELERFLNNQTIENNLKIKVNRKNLENVIEQHYKKGYIYIYGLLDAVFPYINLNGAEHNVSKKDVRNIIKKVENYIAYLKRIE